MKTFAFLITMTIPFLSYGQERYIGLSHDSLISFHAKSFETIINNDTVLLVKDRSSGLDYRFFKFDASGNCILSTKNMQYYDDFLDLEKKLVSGGYKKGPEVELNFVFRSISGVLYTKGKETYVLLFDPLAPNLTRATRTVVYYNK